MVREAKENGSSRNSEQSKSFLFDEIFFQENAKFWAKKFYFEEIWQQNKNFEQP